jgi:hypothetical protein
VSKRHGSFGVSERHLLPLLHVRTANQPTIAAAALYIKAQRWICADLLQMMKYDETLMSELVVSAEGELYISPERSIARHNGQS